MWINDVTLDDFGCFDHERVTDLRNGVNVVAGPQRAGKTTFMGALRHLGYGVPRDGSVPPATNEYALGATVTTDDGAYRIDIDGHGSPSVSTARGPDTTIEDLYANLQKTQYHQLYTISLDELRQSPRTLDGDLTLAEVLLGGAFGDVVKIPQYRDEFGSEARSIGGKHGRGVYDLKEPISTIEDGIEKRTEATAQVDEYEQTESDVEEHTHRLEEIESTRDELETEVVLLDAVSSNYEDIQERRRLNEELADVEEPKLDAFPLDRVDAVDEHHEAYQEARNEAAERRRAFERATDRDDTNHYLDQLQTRYESVKQLLADLSGVRERHDQLVEMRADLQDEWRDLSRRAADLNEEWDGDLNAVREIETDSIARDEVTRITGEYADAVEDHERAQDSLSEARDRQSVLEEQLESAESERVDTDGPPYGVVAGGSVLALLVGIGAATVAGPVAGVFATFLILAATGGVAYREIEPADGNETAVQSLNADLRKANADVEQQQATVEEAEAALEAIEDEFEQLCRTLGLPTTMNADAIGTFHSDVRDLKADVRRAESREEDYEEKVERFRDDLDPLAETLVDVGALKSVPEDPFDDADRLVTAMERVGEHAEAATEVQRAEADAAAARRALIEELEGWREADVPEAADPDELATLVDDFRERASTVRENRVKRDDRDRLRSNLKAVFGQGSVAAAVSNCSLPDAGVDGGETNAYVEDGVLDRVNHVVDEYGGNGSIEARLEEINAELAALEEEATERRDTRAELKNRLEDLRSADDVHEAHETIQTGRQRLEPLAEEYATSRIAEYFLDELYDRFIDRTTGPLLDDASSIFERITDGTYESVETRDELDDLDFTAILADGGIQTPDELSRATVEQLFLAIRIGRIQRESQPLPVILDDSFTNFDPGHRQRTMGVVEELASTNQVFLLTCHPEVVEATSMLDVDATYWRLEAGKFDGPTSESEAKRVLSTET